MYRFKDKTVNNWANRENFKAAPGKYTLLKMEYEDESPVWTMFSE